MTYKIALEEFKTLLTNCDIYACISDKESHTTTDEDGNTITTYSDNSAKSLLDDWINEFDAIYQSIYNSLLALFIDPDDEDRIPDVNYQLINGYADGSRSLEYYDTTTEEFIEKADYWFVRGHLYDMLPKANEGLYVYKYLSNVQSVVNLCKEYEKKYEEYEYSSSGNDDTISISKAEAFWNKNYKDFDDNVNNLLQGLLAEKNKFVGLIQFTRDYKAVYEDVSVWLSKGDSFISALQKTSTGSGNCLGDSFQKIGVAGFALYSSDMSEMYHIFSEAKNIRDNSKYATQDDSNIFLRKIFIHKILTQHNYFNRSASCLDWIKEFRKYYNI